MNVSYLIAEMANNIARVAGMIELSQVVTFVARSRPMSSANVVMFLLEMSNSTILNELEPIPSRDSPPPSLPMARHGFSSLLSPSESCSLPGRASTMCWGLTFELIRWFSKTNSVFEVGTKIAAP